ncbi:hypothetical protein R5W23_003878 [Gemmata sp. JC673]|uniref:SMI1/KNR4 family protein n=1 Tax=Gemmata algarum TaxID=2975278 RepID=A0ABU5F6Q8_9BACT|nr:hypothetical protein [Gemmata algarum]MDY3562412.1 hypothetical protein [Gemmata algarum]
MTEMEWFSGHDRGAMLDQMVGKWSKRQLRLFASACCRRVWPLIVSDAARRVVELTELCADGLATELDLQAAASFAEANTFSLDTSTARANTAAESLATVDNYSGPCMLVAQCAEFAAESEEGERIAQAGLLRDIFGNPFRPAAIDPAWLTSTVVALAEGIYQDRAFERLPILADALQDAGCENADILDHCRGPGPHVRGCWVVDLVLGKE